MASRINRSLLLATGIALFGTAALAAATVVNVADPLQSARMARVNTDGRLAVEQAAPSSFFHSATFSLSGGTGCVVIATAPGTQGLVVRQVRIDVFTNPSPGLGQTVELFSDSACQKLIGDVNPPTIGPLTVSFDPGVAIPAGSKMSALVSGSVQAETYVDGFTVPKGAVPSTALQANMTGRSRQQ